MKLFGHYLFEKDPELKAYKQDKLERERKEWTEACENDGKKGSYVLMSRIPSGILLPFGEGNFKQIPEELKEHHVYAKQGRCHKFNGKKYCYHTGKEMVTEI
jgi:hypothetical protein